MRHRWPGRVLIFAGVVQVCTRYLSSVEFGLGSDARLRLLTDNCTVHRRAVFGAFKITGASSRAEAFEESPAPFFGNGGIGMRQRRAVRLVRGMTVGPD
jgi:hypothetical protein